MTIGRKLALGFGVVLLLFVVAGFVIDRSTTQIDRSLDDLTQTEQPASDAAYEMEINTIGTGIGVLRYVETGDPSALEAVREDEADFRRFYENYQDVTRTPEGREAGREVGELYEEFDALGQDLMDRTDAQEELFARIDGDFVSIDRILDEEVQPNVDVGGTDGTEKVERAANMETEVAEVIAWFGTYLRAPATTYDRAHPGEREGLPDGAFALRGAGLERGGRVPGGRVER